MNSLADSSESSTFLNVAADKSVDTCIQLGIQAAHGIKIRATDVTALKFAVHPPMSNRLQLTPEKN